MAINTTLDPTDLIPWLRREALEQGHNDKEIGRLLARGEWVKVRWGAYFGGDLWRTLSPEDQHRVRARAVLKVSHPSTVLSHVSSIVEQGAPTYGVDLTRVHVTRQDGHPARKTLDVVHHTGELPDEDVLTVNGVRATTGTRAAIETGIACDLESALVAVSGLLHLGLTDPDALGAMADRAKCWPGSLRLPVLLRLADGRFASALESRIFYLCWSQGLPLPQPQYEVRDEAGHLIGACDFAWPEFRVFLEGDGKGKYYLYLREGEDPTDVMLAQQRREEAIIRHTGWICIRLTWEDLSRPRDTARRIRRMLALATPAA